MEDEPNAGTLYTASGLIQILTFSVFERAFMITEANLCDICIINLTLDNSQKIEYFNLQMISLYNLLFLVLMFYYHEKKTFLKGILTVGPQIG